MRRIDIEIPSGVRCQVTGYLYESEDPFERGQDMIEVLLENGLLIDAGWYPEGDASGQYVVSVSQRLNSITSLRTSDVYEAARFVESQIQVYSTSCILMPTTQDVTPEKVAV